MSEPYILTYMLLKLLQHTDCEERDRAFAILVERFRSRFMDYARNRLPSEDDAQSVTNETFVEIYLLDHYHEEGSPCVQECVQRGERSGECTQQYKCIEKAAWSLLNQIHTRNVLDRGRDIDRHRNKQVGWEVDETVPAPKSSEPETSVESKCTLEDIWSAFNSLSKKDQWLINHKPGPGRPDKAREQAIREAWAGFQEAIKRLEEE